AEARMRPRPPSVPAPAENERIPALEPDHEAPGQGVVDEERIDRGLRRAVRAHALARVDQERPRRRFVEQRRIDEPIVDDDLRFPEALERAHGEESRVARTRAPEADPSRLHALTPRPSS